MAAGDLIAFKDEALAADDYLDLDVQPPDTQAIVQLIDHSGDIEVYAYDGSTSEVPIAYQGVGREWTVLYLTRNGERYRIKNTTAGPIYVRVSAMVTK